MPHLGGAPAIWRVGRLAVSSAPLGIGQEVLRLEPDPKQNAPAAWLCGPLMVYVGVQERRSVLREVPGLDRRGCALVRFVDLERARRVEIRADLPRVGLQQAQENRPLEQFLNPKPQTLNIGA